MAICHVVTIQIGNEKQVWGCPDPNAAEAYLHPADQIQTFGEDFTLVECTVAIGVFKNENSVAAFPFLGSSWVFIRFRDPYSPSIIKCHGDGLLDIRLGRTHDHFETLWQTHCLGCLFGIQPFEWILIQRQRGFRFGNETKTEASHAEGDHNQATLMHHGE